MDQTFLSSWNRSRDRWQASWWVKLSVTSPRLPKNTALSRLSALKSKPTNQGRTLIPCWMATNGLKRAMGKCSSKRKDRLPSLRRNSRHTPTYRYCVRSILGTFWNFDVKWCIFVYWFVRRGRHRANSQLEHLLDMKSFKNNNLYKLWKLVCKSSNMKLGSRVISDVRCYRSRRTPSLEILDSTEWRVTWSVLSVLWSVYVHRLQ